VFAVGPALYRPCGVASRLRAAEAAASAGDLELLRRRASAVQQSASRGTSSRAAASRRRSARICTECFLSSGSPPQRAELGSIGGPSAAGNEPGRRCARPGHTAAPFVCDRPRVTPGCPRSCGNSTASPTRLEARWRTVADVQTLAPEHESERVDRSLRGARLGRAAGARRRATDARHAPASVQEQQRRADNSYSCDSTLR
jgi:hypothetical protein